MKKTVRFLGLDVHAETIAVAVAEADGTVRSLGTIANREEAVRKLVKKLGPVEHLRACYEAGPTGYVLSWQLTQLGVECSVIAPSLVPVRAGDRVKTDRRDAEKLARSFRSGDLTPVWVPDAGSEAAARPGAGARGGQAGSVAGPASAEQVPAARGPASGDGGEGVDAALHGLGAGASFRAACAGVDAAGLSARGRTHGRAGQAPGAGDPRCGEAGRAPDPGGDRRAAGAAGRG